MKEIHERGEANVDDALASKLGFDSLDALRDAVAGQLASQHATALRAAVKTNVFDQLADQLDFDVPSSLLQSEYDVVAKSMAEPHDQKDDQNSEHEHTKAADVGLDDDQKKEALAMATRRVRLGLLMTEIGQSKNIQVSEEDLRRTVIEQSGRFPGQEQEVIKYYENNPDAMQQLAGPMFEERVMDYILEMAKVTDVQITAEELYDDSARKISEQVQRKKNLLRKKLLPKRLLQKKAASKKASSKKRLLQKRLVQKKTAEKRKG